MAAVAATLPGHLAALLAGWPAGRQGGTSAIFYLKRMRCHFSTFFHPASIHPDLSPTFREEAEGKRRRRRRSGRSENVIGKSEIRFALGGDSVNFFYTFSGHCNSNYAQEKVQGSAKDPRKLAPDY